MNKLIQLLNTLFLFLKDVRMELNKVTWPEKDDVVSSTTAVLAMVVAISVFLYLIDLVLSKMIGQLIN